MGGTPHWRRGHLACLPAAAKFPVNSHGRASIRAACAQTTPRGFVGDHRGCDHGGPEDGRKRAMARGVKFGRKLKLSQYQREEAIRRRAVGETLTAIAASDGVHVSMISRLGEAP